jgi:3-dehydroquinate synthase
MMQIQVKIPAIAGTSYTVTIGTDLLGGIIEDVRQIYPRHRFFLITDANVLTAGLPGRLAADKSDELMSFIIEPAGEVSKHIATVTAICEIMDKNAFGRDTCILALGGGTVGDIAGFAASIFKRGVPVVQIPTTTVSQADSAVGGKTGVDSTISKNAFGTFWQPAAVFVDVSTLKTLDERQYRAGLVESVKHALIRDAKYFEYLEQNLDKILARDESILQKLAVYNCRIKAAVVEQDPKEANLRRILNYGHTIGHAVESASNFKLLHGESVAIGIVGAGIIEDKLGLVKDDRLGRIKAMLEKLGQPTSIPLYLAKQQVLTLISHDKKAAGNEIRFVLLDKIGQVHEEKGKWAVPVATELIGESIDLLFHE